MFPSTYKPSMFPSTYKPSMFPSSTKVPSAAPSQCRICILEQRIAPYSSDVEKDGTPQRDALVWLADVDPLQLALDTDLYQLLTRYSLAVLYETTNGSDWIKSNNWRSAAAILTCAWDYVTCDGGGDISKLECSK
jgi:hypothetical protein